jgi:TRAP-type C4-dicarboxylate transport system permease small subunit
MLAFFARLAGIKPPLWLLEALAIAALCVTVAGGLMAWGSHRHAQGVAQEKARRDLIDAANDARAKIALAQLNGQVLAARMLLAQAQQRVGELQQEKDNVQTANAALQSDLAAGRQRLRVALAATGQAAPSGPGADPAARGLDTQPGATADLEPEAARRTAELTGEGDSAIIRLNACIVAFDAAKSAVDAANAQ